MLMEQQEVEIDIYNGSVSINGISATIDASTFVSTDT